MVTASGIGSGLSSLMLCFMLTSSLQIPSIKLAHKYRIPLSLRQQATDSPDHEVKPGNVKSDNIDLFAAGPRRLPVKPLQQIVAPTPPSNSDSDSRRSVQDMATSPGIRNAKTELRAELLRLEAEKEQFEIDRLRIEQEKKLLQEIDLIILQIVDNQLSLEQLVMTKRSFVRKELFFRIAELANSAFSTDEKTRFTTLCDDLMATVLRVDDVLHAELSADIQKEINSELNRLRTGQRVKDTESAKVYDDALQQWIEKTVNSSSVSTLNAQGMAPASMNMDTIANSTITDAMGRSMIKFPAAVPINLLPLMVRSPEISQEDLNILKEKIFTPDLLGDVVVDYSSLLATFRGKPGVSAQDTFESANERMAAIPGLSERLRLFMLPEYQVQGMDLKNEVIEKYSGTKYEPVFTVLSRKAEPKAVGTAESFFGLLTVISTFATCFMFATEVNSLNPDFLAKAMTAASGSVDGAAVTVEALVAGREVVGRLLPIVFGLVGLQATHDLGHFLAAKSHDTKISLPYFIPSLQIGIFGSITNFLTFPKTRKAMFDISIAGPALGFTFSLLATLYGLSVTAGASPEVLATYPALPSVFLDSSFLLHELVDQFLHTSTALTATPALTSVHPLVAVGMTGLLTNAFNFLPIGRLDGGRVAMAVGGRQSANSIAFITLIGQAIMFLTNASPISFFWILVVVFLQRGADIPSEDDVTPIASTSDDEKKGPAWLGRLATLAFCIGLTGATILPVPVPYDQQPFVQAPISAPAPPLAPGSSNILQGIPVGKPNEV